MKITKTQKRVNWINQHYAQIEKSRTDDHSHCRGKCYNGATCYNQSSGGYGWWSNALDDAGVDPDSHNFWAGSAPTPSTSINRGIAAYIDKNAPENIR